MQTHTHALATDIRQQRWPWQKRPTINIVKMHNQYRNTTPLIKFVNKLNNMWQTMCFCLISVRFPSHSGRCDPIRSSPIWSDPIQFNLTKSNAISIFHGYIGKYRNVYHIGISHRMAWNERMYVCLFDTHVSVASKEPIHDTLRMKGNEQKKIKPGK